MKTKIKISFITTSLLLLGCITSVHAQNWLTAGNGLTGGTSSTPNEWLGSNNIYDLIIKTNNTQRIRALSGGHVLIGSGTAATYPLTLNDYTNAGSLSSGGNFVVSFHSIVGGAAIGGQDTGNNNAVFGATGSSSDILFATYNGSSFDERMIIKSAGNVGIGSTLPRDKFFVHVATDQNWGIMSYSGPQFEAVNDARSAYVLGRIEANPLVLNALSGGKVGIGTTTPIQTLDVNGRINVSNGVIQKGGAAITSTGDLGLYSLDPNSWMRFVTNGQPMRFFSDGGTGTTSNMTIESNGKVGIGTTSPGYILSVNGLPGCNGYTQFWNYSDINLKTNVTDIDSSLIKILKLHPVKYNYNQDYLNLWNDTIMPNNATELQKIHRGFIAQEVKQIFPEMVGVDSIKGQAYCDLNLSNLQVYLVKAMQEQQMIIDSLKHQQKTTDSLMIKQKAVDSLLTTIVNNMMVYQQTTDSLMAIIANCCTLNSNPKMMNNNSEQTQGETLQVELANNNQIILFQNQPNPFNENTVIRYFVPENITGTAFVIFYDMYGQEIKRAEITTKGFGNINVNTENLVSGIYSYSMIVGGKVIDTKKMIKNK